jgi:hypothetical protein
MKIIPYMRFFWATALSFNFIRQTMLDIQSADEFGLFFTTLGGLLTFSFVSYCIVIGLQEVKRRQMTEAKYFQTFGLLFEMLIFVGGLYLFIVLLPANKKFMPAAGLV